MEQRSKLPIVAAARSALNGLVDHSWEGVPYGEQSLRTFSSKNLSAGALKVYSYASPDAPSPGIAEYQVSQGSLRGFDVVTSGDNAVHYTLPAKIGKGPIVPAMPKGTKGSTILYHLMSYFAENKIDGLRAGQQLTFLILNVPYYKVLNYVGGSNNGTYQVPVTRFDVARLIMPDISKITDIDTYRDDNDDFVLDSEISGEGTNEFLLHRKDGFYIQFKSRDNGFEFVCYFKEDTSEPMQSAASALIVSELVNGVWKRSTSNLHVGNGAGNPLVKTVFSFDQWASLYAPKQIVSSKYLNMGNAATGISGQTATGISGQRSPRRDLGPAGVNAATGISGQRPPQSDLERADGNAATDNSDQNG